MMRKIALLGLLLLPFAPDTQAGTPGKLPGRTVATRQLPDTIARFLSGQFVGRSFTYRQDKTCYYACYGEREYILFYREGTVLGFRFHTMQPPREVAACIPHGIAVYIRKHYPDSYTDVFLPEGEGFRAELYGKEDKILYFDRSGKLLREETPEK